MKQRKFRTQDEIIKLLCAWNQTRMSLGAFCIHHKIAYSTLRKYMNKAADRGAYIRPVNGTKDICWSEVAERVGIL